MINYVKEIYIFLVLIAYLIYVFDFIIYFYKKFHAKKDKPNPYIHYLKSIIKIIFLITPLGLTYFLIKNNLSENTIRKIKKLFLILKKIFIYIFLIHIFIIDLIYFLYKKYIKKKQDKESFKESIIEIKKINSMINENEFLINNFNSYNILNEKIYDLQCKNCNSKFNTNEIIKIKSRKLCPFCYSKNFIEILQLNKNEVKIYL